MKELKMLLQKHNLLSNDLTNQKENDYILFKLKF
jgi:hypothetical protein